MKNRAGFKKSKKKIKELDSKIEALQRSTRTSLLLFMKIHNILRHKLSWYRKWHQNPKSGKILGISLTVCIILMSAIFSFFVFSDPIYISSSQSGNIEEIEKINSEVSETLDRLDVYRKYSMLFFEKRRNQITKDFSNDLSGLLSRRKNLLKAEIKKRPSVLKNYALAKETRVRVPIEVYNYVEKEIEVEGELSSFHSDDFENQISEDFYKLYESGDENTSEKEYNVHFVKKPSKQIVSQKTTARGLSLDSELVLESSDDPSLSMIEVASSAFQPTGNQSTVVLMLNFLDDTSQPFGTAQVSQTMFAGTNSTHAFYQETSFNQTSFSGDVYGWYTIAANKSSGCNVSTWANLADQAATDAGVNLGNYIRRVYLFPNASSCGWAGLAQVATPPTRAWSNGYDNVFLYSHELGHNLGNIHASTKDCGAVAIDDYANCTNSEYGDSYDVMGGSWNLGHFNAAHKFNMDWIPTERVLNVISNGTYTIYPLETSTVNPQAIKIAKPNTSENYYFEYRQPIGVDSDLPSGVTRGAIGHIWKGTYYNTYLLDFTPGNGWTDVALSDGTSFYDPINDITVTQVSSDANSVTLSVDFSAIPEQEGHVLDGWGGIHSFGGASLSPGPSSPYWRFWDIARDFAIRSDGQSGYVLDGFGGIHPFGGAPTISNKSPYWGWDIARRIKLVTDTSGYVLDGWGGVHTFGGATPVSITSYWPFWDIARDFDVRSDGQSGYVLDGFGGIHPFGGAPSIGSPSLYWGWDIARRIELASDTSGHVLDGWGGIHSFGGASLSPGSSSPYWRFWDIARDFVIRSDGQSGYVLDGFGGIHPFGGALPISNASPYWGWDIARMIRLTE